LKIDGNLFRLDEYFLDAFRKEKCETQGQRLFRAKMPKVRELDDQGILHKM